VTNVLYVDAATFLVSFLLLCVFVPQRPPIPQTEESAGILAGLRFVLGDSLFRPMLAASVFLNMFGSMMTASLPVLAFEEFDESARVAGAFFAAVGLGGILGTVLAIRLVGRHDPLRLAAFGIVAFSLPLWALALPLPVAGVLVVLATAALFSPLVNAPLLGILTTRTPEALRAKVMTAVITVATLAGPIGLLIAGPLLEAVGPYGTFLVIAVGFTLMALAFATIMLRNASPAQATEPL
jgi:predicted MFS family arabinose efflux permease